MDLVHPVVPVGPVVQPVQSRRCCRFFQLDLQRLARLRVRLHPLDRCCLSVPLGPRPPVALVVRLYQPVRVRRPFPQRPVRPVRRPFQLLRVHLGVPAGPLRHPFRPVPRAQSVQSDLVRPTARPHQRHPGNRLVQLAQSAPLHPALPRGRPHQQHPARRLDPQDPADSM